MTTLYVRLTLLTILTALLRCTASVALAGEHPLAPDWQLNDVAGQAVRLSDFKGKVVVLDFWATWCRPCREEIPGFVNLQKQYGPKGLVIIGVSMDEGGAKVVSDFMHRTGINYRVVLGTAKVAFLYGGIETIPTTFIIDRAGRVVAVGGGNTDPATFEAEIKPLL